MDSSVSVEGIRQANQLPKLAEYNNQLVYVRHAGAGLAQKFV